MANGLDLKTMFQAGSRWLELHLHVVNGLNVFPVPDGDTGTNMLLTMRAALQEMDQAGDHQAGTLAAAGARGALLGARGNSGVILSQFLQGLASGLAGKTTFTGTDWAQAVNRGVQQAYGSVSRPVEGTILTVARVAAEATMAAAESGEDVAAQLARMVAAARTAQASTPDLLPVLKEAGVTDSGGQGLLYILEGALQGLNGGELDLAGEPVPALRPALALDQATYGYDVQFLIQGEQLQVEAIRGRLSQMGWSVLVVGDDTLVKVHLHAEDPESPLAYGRTLGHISDIVIENMAEQARAFLQPGAATSAEAGEEQVAVVALVAGQGLVEIFNSLGADRIVPGGLSLNSGADELLATIRALELEDILILPNHENGLLAAQRIQNLVQRTIRVVPTQTIPQGIAALLAFNRRASLEDNFRRMAEAAQKVVTLALTRAVKSSSLPGLNVQVGDVLGLCNNHLWTIGQTEPEVVLALLARLEIEQFEIMTIYQGQEVTSAQVEALTESIAKSYPSLQVEWYPGGQADYHYIMSLE
jgi:DAK2 domain fusion protein YloV